MFHNKRIWYVLKYLHRYTMEVFELRFDTLNEFFEVLNKKCQDENLILSSAKVVRNGVFYE